ncbi:hypothetical protein NMG60_11002107 [Bertholletia excelsa]
MEISGKLLKFKFHILVAGALSLVIFSLIYVVPSFLDVLAYFWPLLLSTACSSSPSSSSARPPRRPPKPPARAPAKESCNTSPADPKKCNNMPSKKVPSPSRRPCDPISRCIRISIYFLSL